MEKFSLSTPRAWVDGVPVLINPQGHTEIPRERHTCIAKVSRLFAVRHSLK